MTMHGVLFWVLAAGIVLTALGVVVSRNPIHSALFMVCNMLLLAGAFLSLSAQFVAAVQVIVYAGAIMVLFLFVVMLLNLSRDDRTSSAPRLGLLSALLLAAVLLGAIATGRVAQDGLRKSEAKAATLRTGGTAQTVGYALYDPTLPWIVPFELTSVVLLLGALGAVVLAGRRT